MNNTGDSLIVLKPVLDFDDVIFKDRFLVRKIKSADNEELKNVILQVSAEFNTYDPGSTSGAGSGAGDPEINDLFSAYNELGAYYWVVEDLVTSKILGGGGYKKLKGANMAEMQKLFLLPSARGHGIARFLIDLILKYALMAGYRQIYLETASQMNKAIEIYKKYDFKSLSNPVGETGHFQCGIFMIKDLE